MGNDTEFTSLAVIVIRCVQDMYHPSSASIAERIGVSSDDVSKRLWQLKKDKHIRVSTSASNAYAAKEGKRAASIYVLTEAGKEYVQKFQDIDPFTAKLTPKRVYKRNTKPKDKTSKPARPDTGYSGNQLMESAITVLANQKNTREFLMRLRDDIDKLLGEMK